MKKWLFWSHALAFAVGGVTTFMILAAIANVESQWRYAELKAAHAQIQVDHALAEKSIKEAERQYKEAHARLKVLLPK